MGVIHMDDQLKTLQSWINESSYTVAVTGAGVIYVANDVGNDIEGSAGQVL